MAGLPRPCLHADRAGVQLGQRMVLLVSLLNRVLASSSRDLLSDSDVKLLKEITSPCRSRPVPPCPAHI